MRHQLLTSNWQQNGAQTPGTQWGEEPETETMELQLYLKGSDRKFQSSNFRHLQDIKKGRSRGRDGIQELENPVWNKFGARASIKGMGLIKAMIRYSNVGSGLRIHARSICLNYSTSGGHLDENGTEIPWNKLTVTRDWWRKKQASVRDTRSNPLQQE